MNEHDETPSAPMTAVQWEQENAGYLSTLSSAHADKDFHVVEELLERIAPSPPADGDNVHLRERTSGDVAVADLQVIDPKTGKVSSTTGPAVVKHDGTREWHYLGHLHNASGPAVLKPTGEVQYYYLGQKCSSAAALDEVVARAHRHASRTRTWKSDDAARDEGA